MNPILIVLPILSLLMFDLGLTLRLGDFRTVLRHPAPVLVGLLGQIVLLPLVAWGIAEALHLPPLFYLGLMLIACSPGGSSSNVFSMLAGGDVALSVTLTALSSLITLFTIPVVLAWALVASGAGELAAVHLPVGNLLVQNIVLMAVPIVLGVLVQRKWPHVAARLARALGKCAFPALMLLAGIFFVQHEQTIIVNFRQLGWATGLLVVLTAGVAAAVSCACRFGASVRRTLVIEVGMQNAAQAIAVASSPFIFGNAVIATPAIVYALMMNVVLLAYVGAIIARRKRNQIPK
ncbi:MAG: bile acid:sodium symporter family protein [Muribaculaceae bacterium]|nr:bile acid:sodium symporter family protein [Muribaculaceae bacterium]